jgi:hypothetical protein
MSNCGGMKDQLIDKLSRNQGQRFLCPPQKWVIFGLRPRVFAGTKSSSCGDRTHGRSSICGSDTESAMELTEVNVLKNGKNAGYDWELTWERHSKLNPNAYHGGKIDQRGLNF